MNEEQVVELMKSSQSKADWNHNCDQVKKACGGYPPFWYKAVLQSGVAKVTAAKWGGTDQIKIEVIRR